MSEVKRIADLIQDAIDRGATTVEEIHRSVANLPLKVLEDIEFFKTPVKEVRKIQDRSIGALYDLIRKINREIARLATDMLKKRTAPAPARKASVRPAKRSRAKS